MLGRCLAKSRWNDVTTLLSEPGAAVSGVWRSRMFSSHSFLLFFWFRVIRLRFLFWFFGKRAERNAIGHFPNRQRLRLYPVPHSMGPERAPRRPGLSKLNRVTPSGSNVSVWSLRSTLCAARTDASVLCAPADMNVAQVAIRSARRIAWLSPAPLAIRPHGEGFAVHVGTSWRRVTDKPPSAFRNSELRECEIHYLVRIELSGAAWSPTD